ncbi:hypothetical protein V2J09_006063 [Rumex salicifolius]
MEWSLFFVRKVAQLSDISDLICHTMLDQSSSRVSTDINRFSNAGFEQERMQPRTSTGDNFRLSISSTTPSCTSTNSGQDDLESLGDVYVWGELWSDGISIDSIISSFSSKIDILIPKALETNVVLDAHQIACGVHHVALVSRQGEVFTWGEEFGGRLGHGIEKDSTRPRPVEFLAVKSVEFVACGEYHTCAITACGDLYTWGDGVHRAGILGHDSETSHLIPKRVHGPLEGIRVVSIACGTWHSAVITSLGKLFTFGDGKFGVLGHGDREDVLCPKEVHQLSGLRTVAVACGVWHTAAIVEVMSPSGPNATMSSRKLFTWGDGDKYRLGHGNNNTYLIPTGVSALTDYSFQQIACGHNMTIALTTSGHIFTIGSNEYGQLGNPYANEKLPSLVQEKLVCEFVEEITCGADHVAVLTSRGEVFTWGKGANGRLGHGDTEDQKSPTLVEALKDKIVKTIACGDSFTSSICIHKWISGSDQSICSGCRQAFGFTRKRHNCYNCGLVHCHSCSSKKALRASLAPTPGKPYRVCDACYNKIKSSGSKNVTASRHSVDGSKERLDKDLVKSTRILPSPNSESVSYHEAKSQQKSREKRNSASMILSSQVPSYKQIKEVALPTFANALKPVRSSLPMIRRSNTPPSSATAALSRGMIDNLKKSNGVLSQEVTNLHNQVNDLRLKNKAQEEEIKKLQKNQEQEEAKLVSQNSSDCRIAREVVGSLMTQLKEIVERLPPELCKREMFIAMYQAKSFLEGSKAEAEDFQSSFLKEMQQQLNQRDGKSSSEQDNDNSRVRESAYKRNNSLASTSQSKEPASPFHGGKRPLQTPRVSSDKAKEVTEQFESGVYVTVIHLWNGLKLFKRVRFSKRKFTEQKAEEWWKENRERVLSRYSPILPTPSTATQTQDSASTQ